MRSNVVTYALSIFFNKFNLIDGLEILKQFKTKLNPEETKDEVKEESSVLEKLRHCELEIDLSEEEQKLFEKEIADMEFEMECEYQKPSLPKNEEEKKKVSDKIVEFNKIWCGEGN